jgi:exopolysaccharide biosynthesis polyprenyl glycosylphosphotransferase
MKRSELFFGAVLVPLDALALLLAGAFAYHLRTSPYIQRVRPAVFQLDLPFAQYMQLVGFVTVIVIIIFALEGLYSMRVTRRAFDEFTQIFSGISIGVMLIIVAIFLRAELFHSRFIVLAAYLFAVMLVTFSRFVIRRIQRALLSKGYGIHRVVLVGDGVVTGRLDRMFHQHPELGYRVVSIQPVASKALLEHAYRQNGIDEVIQTDPGLSQEDNMVILDFCETHKIDYKYIPNLFETHAAHVAFRQIGGVPMMELARTPLDGWGRIAKRLIDIAGSIIGLIVFSPFLALSALFIRLDTPGPIVYRQQRVGRNTEPFTMYKFRSMYKEHSVGDEYGGEKAKEFYEQLRQQTNERTGPLFKMKDDPRVTKVGRFLRRTRIDELPQLWNVLKGDMSLFGPRPHLPEEVAKYEKYHQRLFTIKPGVSGMAQVSGNAGLSFEEEAKLDIFYIEHWSLWLDIILLLKTFRIWLTDKNAV